MGARELPVESMGDTLTGMPRGFSDYRETEIAPYLKRKHYVVRRQYSDKTLQSPDFAQEIVRMTEDILPLLQFGGAQPDD